MRKISARLKRRGQGLVEYGLVLVLIAIAVVIIVGFVGSKINNSFSKVGSALPSPP
ncbi:MAG: Flp family type IVb pilin [Chloroflexia bacterium]